MLGKEIGNLVNKIVTDSFLRVLKLLTEDKDIKEMQRNILKTWMIKNRK